MAVVFTGQRSWRRNPEKTMVLLVGLLALSVCAVLIGEECTRPQDKQIAQDFQTLVHGIGLGPAVDLSECAFAFDPRLCAHCPRELGPLPLGGLYCPYHALSIFSYSPLKTKDQDAHSH